jgi:exopolysaccharide biosynthesis polyprenyl glycosylphosphotransferase
MGIAEPSVQAEAAAAASAGRARAARRAQVHATGILTQVLARDAIYRRLLVTADAAATALALWIGGSVVAGASLKLSAIAAIPVTVFVAKVLDLYDRDVTRLHKVTLDEFPDLLQLASLVTLLAYIGQSALFTSSLDQAAVAALWLTMLSSLVVGRAIARAAAGSLTPPERCLFVGDPGSAEEFAGKLQIQGVHAEMVQVLEPDAAAATNGNGAGGADGDRLVDAILPVVDSSEIHRVVLATGPWDGHALLQTVSGLKASGVSVSVLPPISRLATFSFDVDHLPGMAVLGMRRFDMSRSSRRVKRSFDVLFSGIALLLLSPLLAAVALAVKVDTPGPLFFRQRRVGQDGEEFKMLKFRSMVEGADARKHELSDQIDADGLFKLEDDPRVTRVGRLIRRFSLDELPQLINVLRGEMSLVGPRPLIPVEDAMIMGSFRRRLEVRPGMTGHWQILGSLRVPLEEMVTLDYIYVANWSLWTDLKIIARTIPYLALRGNV